MFVKVVDMEDTMNVSRLEGYTSGVRSAAWHPSGSLLVGLFFLSLSVCLTTL